MNRKGLVTSLGLGIAVLTSLAVAEIGFAAHERPAAAGVAHRGSFVTYSNQCTAPNRVHASPIGFSSCSTTATSDTSPLLQLTGGVGGSNSSWYVKPLNLGTASVDVQVQVDLTQVKCESTFGSTDKAGSDCTSGAGTLFNGYLILTIVTRQSDHNNCPPGPPGSCPAGSGTQSATMVDYNLSFSVPCGSRASPPLAAGRCAVTNTVNTTWGSGGVVNGKLESLEVRGLVVQDPGLDGVSGNGCPLVCGTGDENNLALPGLYVP
jgi:hypothetical protein